MTDLKILDPRELILEAYRIEGIGEPDCRTIFFDWALGLPDGRDMSKDANALLTHYGARHPDHPMTRVLAEANRPAQPPPRRSRRKRWSGE